MGRRALPKRGVAEAARFGLGHGNQVRYCFQAAGRMAGQYMLAHAHQRHRAQVFEAIVGELFDQRLVDTKTVGDRDQAVAVRGGLGN